MTIERNRSGAFAIGWVAGAISASPPTQSGWSRASVSATAPPSEWPTISGLPSFRNRIASARMAAWPPTPPPPRRIARSRPVEGDDAEVSLEPFDERMGEMADLAAQSVDEDDRGSATAVEHMQPYAVDIENGALLRRRPLDPSHGEDRQRREHALEPDQTQNGFDENAHSRHHLPLPAARPSVSPSARTIPPILRGSACRSPAASLIRSPASAKV